MTFEVALEGEEDEAKDAPVQYEVTCPACGKTAVFEEDELLDGAPKCPNCGEPLDFEVTEGKRFFIAREKAILENPQIFQNCNLKRNSYEYGQSAREGHSKSSLTQCRAVRKLSGIVHFKLIQRFSLAFCSQMPPMSSALYRPCLVV